MLYYSKSAIILLDPQEMIALGVSSVLGGCCSAMPISASFSRSAVNDASGVRTQMGGLFAGN